MSSLLGGLFAKNAVTLLKTSSETRTLLRITSSGTLNFRIASANDVSIGRTGNSTARVWTDTRSRCSISSSVYFSPPSLTSGRSACGGTGAMSETEGCTAAVTRRGSVDLFESKRLCLSLSSSTARCRAFSSSLNFIPQPLFHFPAEQPPLGVSRTWPEYRSGESSALPVQATVRNAFPSRSEPSKGSNQLYLRRFGARFSLRL